MRVLESSRLVLKPVERADLPALLELRWDSAVMVQLLHDPISLESQTAWFERIRESGDVVVSIFVKGDDAQLALAGTTGLFDIDRRHQRATWRLRISPAYQGQGIAFEASKMIFDYGFNTLNLQRIVSDSFADNARIVKLSEKLGMKAEGQLRRHYFHQGQFRDAISFGILRDEFDEK